MLYIKGQGVNKNSEEAVKWLQLAAKQGYAVAQTNLTLMYVKGQGVSTDYEKPRSGLNSLLIRAMPSHRKSSR
jgi:TPR repeat protein